MSPPGPTDDVGVSDDAAVAAYLDALYDGYEGFDVTQTTVSVGPAEFSEIEARGDVAEARVRVEGADGVLAVPDGDEWVSPGGVVDDAESLSDAAGRMVREQTGVDCDVEGLHRVSIACVQCEEIGDEVWELTAVFAGSAEPETPEGDATWRDSLSDLPAAF